MIIYADIFFIINFCMDFLILWVVNKLIKKKAKVINILAGAFLGAGLYCLALFIPFINKYFNFIFAESIMAVSLAVAFRPYSFAEFIKQLIFIHISAFGIGGAGIALFYFTDISGVLGEGLALTAENFSVKILIASAAITYIIIKLGNGWINTNIINKRDFCTVKLGLEDKSATVTALVDSGNSLSDPISGLPVTIVEFAAIEGFFPKEIRKKFYQKGELSAEDIINDDEATVIRRLRMIPFASLENENGMLLGFKPDFLEIYDSNENIVAVSESIVGVCSRQLSCGKGYNALVNPDIFLTQRRD